MAMSRSIAFTNPGAVCNWPSHNGYHHVHLFIAGPTSVLALLIFLEV